MEQTNTPQQPSRKKAILSLLVLLALPAKAESADYETTLDRLGRLQALAEQYIEEKNSGDSRNTRLYNDVLRLQRQHHFPNDRATTYLSCYKPFG